MFKSKASWKIKDAVKYTRRSFRRPSARGYGLLLISCALLVVTTGCRRDMQDQPRYEAYEHSDFFRDGLSSRPLVEGTVPRGYLRDDTQLYTGKKVGGGVSTGAVNALQGTGGGNMSNSNTAQPSQGAARGAGNNAGGATTTTADGMVNGSSSAGAQMSTGGSSGGATNAAATAQAAAQGTYDPTYADTFPFPVTQDVLNRGQERFQIFCSMCHGAEGKGDGMVVRRGYRQPPSYHTAQLRSAPVGHFFDVITNGWGSMPNYAAQIPVRDRWAIVAYIRALQFSRQGTPADLPAQQQQSSNAGSEHGGAAAGGEHK